MNEISEMIEELKLDTMLALVDLANANAEVACLKYENDQLKKEIDMLSRTLEYMTDERDAMMKTIYQVLRGNMWEDCTKSMYDINFPEDRRIVYASNV